MVSADAYFGAGVAHIAARGSLDCSFACGGDAGIGCRYLYSDQKKHCAKSVDGVD